MHNGARPSILLETDDLNTFSILEISVDQKTKYSLEEVARSEGKTLSEWVESILMAHITPTEYENQDGPTRSEESEIPDEWEKLTNELLRLESLRPAIVQLERDRNTFRSSAGPHQSQVETHDQRIRACENQMENLTARRRNQSTFDGLIADYYDR